MFFRMVFGILFRIKGILRFCFFFSWKNGEKPKKKWCNTFTIIKYLNIIKCIYVKKVKFIYFWCISSKPLEIFRLCLFFFVKKRHKYYRPLIELNRRGYSTGVNILLAWAFYWHEHSTGVGILPAWTFYWRKHSTGGSILQSGQHEEYGGKSAMEKLQLMSTHTGHKLGRGWCGWLWLKFIYGISLPLVSVAIESLSWNKNKMLYAMIFWQF